MPASEIVYLGIINRVIALELATGRRLWVTELTGVAFTVLLVVGNCVLAAGTGQVYCLSAASGTLLWVKKLKGAYGSNFVTVLVEGDYVLAATRGEVYCLNAADGALLWHDPLKGYGYGLISLATQAVSSPTPTAAVAEEE